MRYEVISQHFKGVLYEDGNAISEGELRADPWVVLVPVARAIAVADELERQRSGRPRRSAVLGRLSGRRPPADRPHRRCRVAPGRRAHAAAHPVGIGHAGQVIAEVARSTTKPIARFKVRKPQHQRKVTSGG
ncbi:hypothetical protein ABZ297_24680 [Nonomuraea sp. NPDC005983]|uniref:hypothetical protein n=1 Tax=Nonomuraea sp. NPDC005983 TaxID=3155595 RepID=UPI0033BB3C97